MESVIEFKEVSKHFGSVKSLNQLSFRVSRGELFGLLGPNGAGKSTALSLLLGLRKATSGEVLIHSSRPLGATPQDLAFPPHLKVHEVMKLVSAHFEESSLAEEHFKELGLEPLLNRLTGGLSGGEKRRLGVYLALLGNPDILVMDEPTTGLDVEAKRELWRVLRLLKEKGKTVILTSHDLAEVEELADRVLLIDRGTALFEGTVDEIRQSIKAHRIELESTYEFEKFSEFGVLRSESRGPKKILVVRDSDQFVRQMVDRGIEFQNLEISISSLEEAFLVWRGRSP